MKQSRTRKVLRKAFSVFLFFIVTAHQCYSNPTINNLQSQISQTRAVIKQPVVDMSLNSARLEYICASPEVKKCPRAHQGLYNELVDCIEEDGEFVKIACPNIIYGFNPITQKPLNTLWVDKKYLVPLQHLSSNYLASIPHPRYAHEPTIVLVYPWRHYSVGTRFKHLRDLDTADAYAITCVDFQEDNVLIDYVPKQTAIQEIMRDTQTCRKLFVAIANALVDRVHTDSNGCVIPYVWGGSSFVTPSVDADFYLEDGLWQR